MSVKFPAQIWEWNGAEVFTLVSRACLLGRAVEFLALEAQQQSQLIPDCAACETWSTHILRIHDFLESFQKHDCSAVTSHLEVIWSACNNLSAAAFHCHDHRIFSNSEWDVVRHHARAALKEMDWGNLRAYSNDLMTICR